MTCYRSGQPKLGSYRIPMADSMYDALFDYGYLTWYHSYDDPAVKWAFRRWAEDKLKAALASHSRALN
jgi:hypothetical protein